jgi:DNA-binding NarL/FixJ family response regulator
MINVILADHQAIYCAGMAKVLAVEEDIRIVGQPQYPEQLLNGMERLRPRVVVLASSMQTWLPQVQEIARKNAIAVLMLCDNTETASDFMRLGVQGVIYRSASSNIIVEAIRRLSRGQSFLHGPGAEGQVDDDLVGARVQKRLSARELRIIAAIVQGYKNREIASQLETTEQVVKNALRTVFDKIGVSDRLELALFVVHHRILAQATAAVAIHPARSRLSATAGKARAASTAIH